MRPRLYHAVPLSQLGAALHSPPLLRVTTSGTCCDRSAATNRERALRSITLRDVRNHIRENRYFARGEEYFRHRMVRIVVNDDDDDDERYAIRESINRDGGPTGDAQQVVSTTNRGGGRGVAETRVVGKAVYRVRLWYRRRDADDERLPATTAAHEVSRRPIVLDGTCDCPAFAVHGPCKHMAAAGLALVKHHRKPGSYRPSKICVDRVDEQDRFERWLRGRTRDELIELILDEPTIVRQLSRRESEYSSSRRPRSDDDDDSRRRLRVVYDDLRRIDHDDDNDDDDDDDDDDPTTRRDGARDVDDDDDDDDPDYVKDRA